jgi:peptide/nickel transport system permease protein
MQTFIIRRLLQIILVLIIVTVFVFLLVRLLPGDPILLYLTAQDMEVISLEQLDAIRHDLGLDRPMIVQYFDWLGHAVRGDLGTSIINRGSIAAEIARRVPISMYLSGLAFIISIIVGIPLGLLAAVRRGTWIDSLVTSLGNLGITMPIFWLGILLIYFFGMKLDWLPIFGWVSPFTDFGDNLKHIVLPVFVYPFLPLLRLCV